ncbi:hypothetical protein FTO68_08490 [Methanocalculus taiwanensis]|uniref:Uncharacterized protein n=1 Tax=Methanocalculus taiwanensis TaxID=106207 RepID=A0ABD4TJB4_9EURY|nr:hypothetical protein [Methanocalculus taiwanensis]MCQ1539014.1 hypothetical protein [Methanocalculus taiwanensis]
MKTGFIYTKYKTDCYHCHVDADQVIKVVPQQAQVICSNCGATRVFIPRIHEVGTTGSFTPISCYDVWNLEPTAECRNCHTTGIHDLFVGCNHFTVRCRNCGFTQFYKFNLQYIGKCDIEEENCDPVIR